MSSHDSVLCGLLTPVGTRAARLRAVERALRVLSVLLSANIAIHGRTRHPAWSVWYRDEVGR